MLFSIIKKIKVDINADRIGPDIPFTHFFLYFKKYSHKLLKRKMGHLATGAEVRPGAYLIHPSKIYLGKNVVIRPNTMLFGDPRKEGFSIIIEDYVLMGSGVHIYVSNHAFNDNEKPIYDQGHTEVKPVVIREGAWIGANCVILAGVEIGRNAVIGAGAVVSKNVNDYETIVSAANRIL